MRSLLRKSVIFFENIDDNHRSWFASATPPAMAPLGRFGILADGRPIRPGDRVVDALPALIEVSGGRWQGRTVEARGERVRLWQAPGWCKHQCSLNVGIGPQLAVGR
jgi:hypothetical protein